MKFSERNLHFAYKAPKAHIYYLTKKGDRFHYGCHFFPAELGWIVVISVQLSLFPKDPLSARMENQNGVNNSTLLGIEGVHYLKYVSDFTFITPSTFVLLFPHSTRVECCSKAKIFKSTALKFLLLRTFPFMSFNPNFFVSRRTWEDYHCRKLFKGEISPLSHANVESCTTIGWLVTWLVG